MHPVVTVYMMRPIQEMGFDVPKTLSRRMAWGVMDDVSIAIEDYRQRNVWVWAGRPRRPLRRQQKRPPAVL